MANEAQNEKLEIEYADKEASVEEVNHVSIGVYNKEELSIHPKTWVVVVALCLSFGFSFWNIPVLATIGSEIAIGLGDPSASVWWITLYTTTTAISSMLFASNSDLFGRRWFVIVGNVLVCAGLIMMGATKNSQTFIAATVIEGLGAGLAQLAAFALPELLPNRIRHVGIVISDLGTCACVVLGPIASKYAIRRDDQWRWLFYAPSIGAALIALILFFLYYPPKHPRGIPWGEAIPKLDYLGGVFFTVGLALVMTGVIYTNLIPSSSPRIIGLLVSGFVMMIVFALYEHFGNLPFALTPPHVFSRDMGREFSFPFVAASITNMFYYSTSIVYPTAINVLYTDPTTPLSYQLALTLPQNLGMVTGQLCMAAFASRIKHWKIQYTISVSTMVAFGALLALTQRDNRGMTMAFAFLCQLGYGWSIPLSFTFVQLGVPQVELGVSGGLAAVGRWTGGSLASAIYLTILSNVVARETSLRVPAAAIAAGLPASSTEKLLQALPKGVAALQAVPGMTTKIISAVSAASQECYGVGIRSVSLSSLGFGVVGIICVLFCNDISKKLTPKIEVFLENDKNAERNKFH